MTKECTCRAAAPSVALNGEQPRPQETRPRSLESGQSSPSIQQWEQLVQMHQELLSMVGALIEQNNQILGAVSQVTDDFDAPPTTYLDGSPIVTVVNGNRTYEFNDGRNC